MKTAISRFLTSTVILLALMLASCSSNDDSTNGGDTTATVKSVTYNYSFKFSKDLLSVAKIYVSYLNATGDSVKEELTDTAWAKSVTFTTFPSKMAYRVSLVSRGSTLTKSSYSINRTISVSSVVTYSNGTTENNTDERTSATLSVPQANVEIYLSKYKQLLSSAYNLTLSADKKTFTATYISANW